MSISKAQALAEAEGFLDEVGSGNPDELQPRETIAELLLLAGELVEMAQDNLNEDKSNASGELSKTIQAEEPITAPGLMQIDIKMNFYGKFINAGIKGTKGGAGLYKFKNEGVSDEMLSAFKKYMKDARSKIGSVKQHIGYESKNANIALSTSAYLMARNTKRKGIKATYFMDKAIDETDKKVQERLGDALAIDVLNSLPDELN